MDLNAWNNGSPCALHEFAWCAACKPVDPTIPPPPPPKPPPKQPRPQVPKSPSRVRRLWSDEELDVLVAIFFSVEFSAGDDNRPENHAMALAMDRTPSAIDRQWRNIADLQKGVQTLHIGANVERALNRYLENPGGAKESARAIVERKQWDLRWLL